MSINVEFEQLDRESKVNENIYKADRNFEKTKIALANARHKNDKIQADDFISKNGKTFQQVLEEIDKKRQEIIDLIRGINVNVQGTVLETQFMKKSVFDKDNDNIVDRAKTADYAKNYIIEEFRIDGDADKFYPIVVKFTFNNSTNFSVQHISIFRNYSWTAPTEWNNSTVHKGGLQLEIDVFANGWGGLSNWLNAKWASSYIRVFGGLSLAKTKAHLIVWLRGGGAVYHIYSTWQNIEIEIPNDAYMITYPTAPHHNEVYPVLTEQKSYVQHQGGYAGEYVGIPLYVPYLNTVVGHDGEAIIGKGFNSDTGNLNINYRGAKKAIKNYYFKSGIENNELANIRAKAYYEENTKLSEKYVLKSEYDKLVQRVQALERKTQNL